METASQKHLALSRVPSVSLILEHPAVRALAAGTRRDVLTGSIRALIQELRDRIMRDEVPPTLSRKEMVLEIVSALEESVRRNLRQGLRRVINATGIVLHTNLGRSPLPDRALQAVTEVSSGYSNLEFNLDTGERGSRQQSVASLISRLVGAESALVVNNNAAAVFLCLNTLARDREVVVSRGQQVEIGGSFRIPDVISASGARMVEVGTTNKTHLYDYEDAITSETAVLLKIHTSNFKIVGFSAGVSLPELVTLGRRHNLIVMEDLGSGSIVDLSSFGLPYEPTVGRSIQDGADIVTFSGDKLLGGPQAGIIAGRRDLIAKIARNPLARAVRVDKMALAALEEVIKIYLEPENLPGQLPVLRLLAKRPDELARDAASLLELIAHKLGDKVIAEVVDDWGEAGGGSLPGALLAGKAVALVAASPGGPPAEAIQARLRQASPPVIARIHKGRVLFNVRTLLPGDAEHIAEALLYIFEGDSR